MRRLVCTITFLSTLFTSFAATAESMSLFFDAVLKSEALASVINDEHELKSITMTDTYRCPGCYRFAVQTTKMTNANEELSSYAFRTALDLRTHEISVEQLHKFISPR